MKLVQFIFIVLILCGGLIFHLFGIVFPNYSISPLGGYYEKEEKPRLTLNSFVNLAYQTKFETHLKQEAFLYPLAVRTSNQCKYELFGELRPGIVEGDDGYLFESLYIESLQGDNFVGQDSVDQLAIRLKQITDSLQVESGKQVLVALAINKAFLHQDKLPSDAEIIDKTSTNYKSYLNAFDRLDIPYIDFNAYFSESMKTSAHQLTTKNGVHWSKYGALIAADSINRAIGGLLNKELNSISFDSLIVTNTPAIEDIDIAASLNLLHTPSPEKYTYVQEYLSVDSAKYKPKVLLIGDSFAWTIFNQYVPHEYWHAESNFLYYYKQLWQVDPTNLHGTWTKDFQRKELISNVEVILLLYSPMNMNDLGSGFIEEN